MTTAEQQHSRLMVVLCQRLREKKAYANRVLCESHFYVGTLVQGHGVDEADLALFQCDDQRLRADAFAEESHAAQQVSVGDACTREDQLFSRRELFGFINFLAIL